MDKKLVEWADEIYNVGFKNGQIEMKNKVLKKINRDWSLVTIKKPMDLIMEILKNVNKIPLSKTDKQLTTRLKDELTDNKEVI